MTVVARITGITIVEYSTGKSYSVVNGGIVQVNDERVKIKVTVKNIGTIDGTVYAQILVNGVPKETKTAFLKRDTLATFEWQLEISGEVTITARAGHESEFQPL